MHVTPNIYRGRGLDDPVLAAIPFPSTDLQAAKALLQRCPKADVTQLVTSAALAEAASVAQVLIKDERKRMGLGSFKALGAAYVIACDAAKGQAAAQTYVTASAGNHGLSVAAGAQAFGARAVIYLSDTVPETFADRLRGYGAQVARHGATYEASMAAAAKAAESNGWALLSDSSWPGYTERPHRLMEGYLALMAEVFAQCADAPTHVFLQAGVGGLAGAVAAAVRARWGGGPTIIVVEPDAAPALAASVAAGHAVVTQGPVSIMGRLDCKEPSLIALKGLARDADFFATITEDEGQVGADTCARHGLASTPSGAAGIAGLLAATLHRKAFGLTAASRVLIILSEGPEA